MALGNGVLHATDMTCSNFFRVKSLSKGNNAKKDITLPTANLRESTNLPLSSGFPTFLKGDINDDWPQSVDRDEYEMPEETYDQTKVVRKKSGKSDTGAYASEDKRKTAKCQVKWKDVPKVDTNNFDSDDDDLNELLQVIDCVDDSQFEIKFFFD